jgi:hypothetical protein
MSSSAAASSSDSVPIALDVYPSLSGYIGKLHVAPSFVLPADDDSAARKSDGNVNNIIVLDRSGSMGSHVQRLITKVLPLVYAKIDAASGSKTDSVRLLAFDNSCTNDTIAVNDLVKNRYSAQGGTQMASAVRTLHQVLQTLDPAVPVRLLTVSDGEIMDGPQARTAATDLSAMVKKRGLVINSQAVRYFSSRSQPDAQALSCLLQLSAEGIKVGGTLNFALASARLVSPFHPACAKRIIGCSSSLDPLPLA